MGQKKPITPNSRIRRALRLLWMRSRERAQALKNTGYTCAYCGAKQSAAKGKELKLDVHHLDGIQWNGLCDIIRERMLPDPSRLAPACKACHSKLTNEEASK